MSNQSYKFSFLIIWCCMLTISIVIMVAMIVKDSNQKAQISRGGKNGKGGDTPAAVYQEGSGQNPVDHIQLVRGSESPWRHSSTCFCMNSSLVLQNDSIIITTGGFYYSYAQVTFIKSTVNEGTVTLVANENVPGKATRKLSEAQHGNGTVSMSRMIRLRNGDSVKLNISPDTKIFKDGTKTYWGLFLIAKRKDK